MTVLKLTGFAGSDGSSAMTSGGSEGGVFVNVHVGVTLLGQNR